VTARPARSRSSVPRRAGRSRLHTVVRTGHCSESLARGSSPRSLTCGARGVEGFRACHLVPHPDGRWRRTKARTTSQGPDQDSVPAGHRGAPPGRTRPAHTAPEGVALHRSCLELSAFQRSPGGRIGGAQRERLSEPANGGHGDFLPSKLAAGCLSLLPALSCQPARPAQSVARLPRERARSEG
jgi:hypothetical protein